MYPKKIIIIHTAYENNEEINNKNAYVKQHITYIYYQKSNVVLFQI